MAESPLFTLTRLLGGVVLMQGRLGHQILGQLLVTDTNEVAIAGAVAVVAATTRQQNAVAQIALRTAVPALAVRGLLLKQERRLERKATLVAEAQRRLDERDEAITEQQHQLDTRDQALAAREGDLQKKVDRLSTRLRSGERRRGAGRRTIRKKKR